MKEKFIYIQNLRGMCIIFVVAIHSFCWTEQASLNNAVNIEIRTLINFCVAMFIFISAYLINIEALSKHPWQFIKRRLWRLGIPYLIWTTAYSLLSLIRQPDISILDFFLGWLLGSSKVGIQLHFIVALIQLALLSPLLVALCKKKNVLVDVLILLITPAFAFANGLWNDTFGANFPYYSSIFVAWISFYYFAIFIRVRKITFQKIKKVIWPILIITIVLVSCVNLYEYIVFWNRFYCATQIKVTNCLYSFVAIIFFYTLKDRKTKLLHSKNLLTTIGDYSYGIFYTHLLPFVILNWTVYTAIIIPDFPIIQEIILFVAYFGTGFVITLIANKFLKPQTCQILGLR